MRHLAVRWRRRLQALDQGKQFAEITQRIAAVRALDAGGDNEAMVQAMRDFAQSLNKRMRLLVDLDAQKIDCLFVEIPVTGMAGIHVYDANMEWLDVCPSVVRSNGYGASTAPPAIRSRLSRVRARSIR